jgi:hypothetical protein
MNIYEIALILLAAAILYGVLALRDNRPARNVVLVLCIVPALFLALEGATETLTCDEMYMVREITDFSASSFHSWNLGNFHSSIAATGNIVNALRAVFSLNDLQAKVLVKTVHWLLGFLCLAGIFWTVNRRWVPRNLFREYSVIYFYSALLLPSNILSLKVANYDLLSMLLAIWGLILCFVGLENVKAWNSAPQTIDQVSKWRVFLCEILGADRGFTLFGIILITLAAQEKLIAAPILHLAFVLSALMRIRSRGRVDWWLPVQIGIGSVVALLTLLLTYGVVAIWRPPSQPSFDLAIALGPLASHVDIALRALGIGEAGLPMEITLMLATAALASMLIWRLRILRDQIATFLQFAFPVLLIAALAVGMIGFYKVSAYLHPVYPIPKGYFIPQDEMNGQIIHFLSLTRWQHLVNKTASAYSIFAMSFPSVFALVTVIVMGVCLLAKQPKVPESLLGFLLVGILSSLMSLVYVLTNTAVGTRYFNVWVFTEVLLLVTLGCNFLRALARPYFRIATVAAFCLGLLLEVLPFRPIFGAFWPWWANAAGLPTASVAEPGKMMPVWPGWGEEAMIAGRHLRKMAGSGQLPSSSFQLFTVYPGDWICSDPSIETHWVGTVPYRKLSFTENDYYVLNRAEVFQAGVLFPKDKRPLWTIDFRGVSQAWVFRGSDIKDVYYARGCPFFPVKGHVWLVHTPELQDMPSDGPLAPTASKLSIYEDSKLLGPAHSDYESILSLGNGRYRHWQGLLYFSTSDNSNPNTNGRDYQFRLEEIQ